MENASKALLMATEILVGVLLLTLMAALFYTFSNYETEMKQNQDSRELYEFNSRFQVYAEKANEENANEEVYLTVQDVLSIYNLAKDYNEKLEEEAITVYVNGTPMKIGDKNKGNYLKQNYKKKYYIQKISYNKQGKIYEIRIEEI